MEPPSSLRPVAVRSAVHIPVAADAPRPKVRAWRRSGCGRWPLQNEFGRCGGTFLAALLGHRAASSRRQRGLTLRAQEAEEAEPTEPEESLGDLRQMQLAKVPKHLWPFLMSAAQAAAAGTSTELSSSVASAAQGVAAWRGQLLRGAAWRDEDGADWPREAPLRNGWQDLLREKGLPHLVKRYPKLVDPLMASLLESMEKFYDELQEMEPESGDGEGEELEQGGDSAAGAAAAESSDENGEEAEAVEAQVAQKLMEDLAKELGDFAEAVNAADSAFGSGAGDAMADSFGVGQGQWHETMGAAQSKELMELAKIMRSSPELRELLRNLGRRSAVRGPLQKLPEEIWLESGPDGVIRSPAAPAEATGVTLSGNWDTMLPSEAQLLAANSPMLRTLHHARRIEQSLLCYDRSSWLHDDSQTTGRFEVRPRGKAGPLIVCLDTSGSMLGDRELLSKALVVECVRQAHRQRRPCYLYAFSGAGDLRELELDLSQDGFRKVLEFLRQSFGGGTYLEDALSAASRKLEDETWHNADLLIVTDGELNANTDEASVARARAECGTKVTGLVLADRGGDAMERLCDELYLTGNASHFRGAKGLQFPKLKKVELSTLHEGQHVR